jgi:hypothetical protein
MLTLYLGLDDVFLLHEEVFPRFGVPEEVVLSCYPVFMLFYLFWFYPVILKTEYVLLGTALLFFGISVTVDLFDLSDIDLFFLFEDGVKLIGIVSWLAYFFRVGVDVIHRNDALLYAAPKSGKK